ncbi:PTS sugar transporter subunit IIA [Caenibacillus caldisaponilyticus]|jgi:PTS system mannitol-specific IIA component|uniref:PTS sugar transporter subunit IIA n=1 Tax=Caenibacillus caldisaponilyticus TaxID=1674942 RepID=UPI0009882F32|nr:PTS sugar transporter subunit IIA [Caenibacillus caldisaponilyticus]
MTNSILNEQNILLNQAFASKEEAIRETGKLLVERGYVEEAYIDKMLEREALASTYMGNYVAIPHGTEDAKETVKASGIGIVQVPDGVDFGNGNVVKLLIGIAGKNNEHIEMLSKIAIVCSKEENVDRIIRATDKKEILSIFNEVNE